MTSGREQQRIRTPKTTIRLPKNGGRIPNDSFCKSELSLAGFTS
jgi:hypothetical protein